MFRKKQTVAASDHGLASFLTIPIGSSGLSRCCRDSLANSHTVRVMGSC